MTVPDLIKRFDHRRQARQQCRVALRPLQILAVGQCTVVAQQVLFIELEQRQEVKAAHRSAIVAIARQSAGLIQGFGRSRNRIVVICRNRPYWSQPGASSRPDAGTFRSTTRATRRNRSTTAVSQALNGRTAALPAAAPAVRAHRQAPMTAAAPQHRSTLQDAPRSAENRRSATITHPATRHNQPE